MGEPNRRSVRAPRPVRSDHRSVIGVLWQLEPHRNHKGSSRPMMSRRLVIVTALALACTVPACRADNDSGNAVHPAQLTVDYVAPAITFGSEPDWGAVRWL